MKSQFRRLKFVTIVLVGLMACCWGAQAGDPLRPFVHPLFSDHMVLQRDRKDPIWGWATPGQRVTVQINGKTAVAITDASGLWMAKIGPFKAGGPYTLEVSGETNVMFTDVLVGDVWLCSGQSNMEMGISRVKDATNEIAAANHPNIRLFTVPRVVSNEPQPMFGPVKDGMPAWQEHRAEWLTCTPANIQIGNWDGFSAAGYFFGRKLSEDIQVPIGLIQSAWGGTICEAWISGDALQQIPAFTEAVEKVRFKSMTEQSETNTPAPTARVNPNVATVPVNGMISPLTPMALKGAIWYQGEANAGRGYQYRRLMATLIRDWRNRFSGGEFSFFIVQLAAYTVMKPEPGNSGWSEVREAQQWAANEVGKAATASAIDIGDAKDIHPKNKQEIGRRLALCAEAITYGKKVEYEGPTFQSLRIKGDQAVVRFTHAEGMKAKGDSVNGFAIAGADGHFVWAQARIDGHDVIVSSPQVPQPKVVRYGWADNPNVNLYNGDDLPANPFRTDSPK